MQSYEQKLQDKRVQKRTARAACVARKRSSGTHKSDATTQWYVDPARRAWGNHPLEEIHAT